MSVERQAPELTAQASVVEASEVMVLVVEASEVMVSAEPMRHDKSKCHIQKNRFEVDNLLV